jgi:C_GCAxxG_C_C family probable redox protein
MNDELLQQQAGERAAGYFGEGYHCAEAVVAAFLETMGESAPETIAHATAFGGGFGKTFAEACGVLSGGMIAIGHMCGRRQRGENWDKPAELGAELRRQFIECNGTSNCAILRERFGQEEQMTECRKLVREGTIALIKVYQNEKRNGGLRPTDKM